MGKRTSIDFSKHVYTKLDTEHLKRWCLQVPGTSVDKVVFLDVEGLCVVTGDYGTWTFCRPFHPSPDGMVLDQHWCEKLRYDSTQDPYVWDRDEAMRQIRELRSDIATEVQFEDDRPILEEWLDDMETAAQDGESYFDAAKQRCPDFLEAEYIPLGMVLNHQLAVVFDAFEEMCARERQYAVG